MKNVCFFRKRHFLCQNKDKFNLNDGERKILQVGNHDSIDILKYET